ncbi:MAG: hypothetical protein Q9195_006821 [Heterodermia aff. obscurata]
MSVQLDGAASPLPIRREKSKEKESRKRDKKRKRTGQHSDQTSPPKKHHSRKSVPDAKPTSQTSQAPQAVETSPFFEQTSSFYLPLSPICQQYPLQGLCAEHLSPLILTYYPPLDGVVLSYSNAKLSTDAPGRSEDDVEGPVLAQSIDEYSVSYIWVTADFLVFRPRRGCRIEGWINLQSEGNIGLVCYNFFSVSIERKRLPKEWKWIRGGTGRFGARKSKQSEDLRKQAETPQVNGFGDEDGYFEDGDGNKVEGYLTFTVKNMEASRISDREPAHVSIEGTLLSNAEEQLREQDSNHMQGNSVQRLGAGKDGDYTMAGALYNGYVDNGSDKERTPKLKHRLAY